MTKLPRYKVVCKNGIANGSKLIDMVTGEPVANITGITLKADAGGIWRAEVVIVGVAVDVNLQADGVELRNA